jgi:hypothetical protein
MIAMHASTSFVRPFFLLAAAGLAVACGRIPGQFEILNDQVPTATCTIPTEETVYSGQGVLDLSLVRGGQESAYFFFPLLKNNLAGSTDGTDTNKIFLSSFAVDISVLSGAPTNTQALFNMLNANAGDPSYALLHYRTPWSGSVDSGGGLLSAAVPAFPVDLAAQILKLQEIGVAPSLFVNLRVRAFGSTTSRGIESDPFDYPIAICDGCLVANTQPCPYSSMPANPGNPCNPAQDNPVDCCLSGDTMICPPVVAQ